MPSFLLSPEQRKAKSERTSSLSEGETAKRLLEANGYVARSRVTNGQYEFPCPFHEEPGPIPRGHSTNFYLDKNSSKYYCQAASCGESGNLVTLERYFGVESNPAIATAYRGREQRLRDYQAQLTPERRQVFYDHGLNDATIERFRYGYDPALDAYVLPYLEATRPIAFRYYDPDWESKPPSTKKPQAKYWWESGTSQKLYNSGHGVGDDKFGRVFICEGEQKAAFLVQQGWRAVAVPGANAWNAEWSHLLNHAREIVICFDNDNPVRHRHSRCNRCRPSGVQQNDMTADWECLGHNPGQECARKLLNALGPRAKNMVLPLPTPEAKKTDINEFFMRDGGSKDEFAMLATGQKSSPFVIQTLAQIQEEPPEEASFIVDNGILPAGGRLLVSGAPKVGKSIFIENLALSIASGVPFLRRFAINRNEGPSRVLLLDRELSRRSLYDRLDELIENRPGYQLAAENLFVDHEQRIMLDTPEATSQLVGLITANNIEVVFFDTAYKFFSSGDVEKATSVIKAFATLDRVIQDTGVSVVLTHHHRKSSGRGKEEQPHADQVTGSLYWTGWPNASVLINFLNRKVADPFNTVASFVAFRDAAPPDPLAMFRDRTSISYQRVDPWSFDPENPEGGEVSNFVARGRATFDSVAAYLMEVAPVLQDEFVSMAAQEFKVDVTKAKILMLDVMDRHPDFAVDGDGSRGNPYVLRFLCEPVEEKYQYETPKLEIV